ARVSEPPGYFDTDNLISNEDSYLHVVGTLNRIKDAGAYLGVGPDQNFSYIAALKPRVAFIIDIRRDNLLEHLLFKSIFALSRNRLEYLCLLCGRTAPADTTGWGALDIAGLLSYTDTARRDAAAQANVLEHAKRRSVQLSAKDVETIGRFHAAFVAQGPTLRFNTHGRPPQWYDPDLRQLLRETDRSGRQSSYLAHEADFQFVKSLAERNRVRVLHVQRRAVPVSRRRLRRVRAQRLPPAEESRQRHAAQLLPGGTSAGGLRLPCDASRAAD